MNLEGQIAVETSIEKLPENALLEIMQYVSMRDRYRARRVCKSWNQILSGYSLWRHVDLLDNGIDLRTMWQIVRNHLSPFLLTLKIRGYAYSDDSNKGKPSISNALLRELSARCSNLRHLHLYDCKTSNILFESLPPSITCLEVVNNKWRPRWMKDKQIHLPNLKHLTLDKSVRMNNGDMIDVAAWKNLKYLSLKQCNRVRTPGVKTIAEHLSELEFLNLCFVPIGELAVFYIAKHLKKLKELCLASCESVSDRAIALIAKGIPGLNILDISCCPLITMKGLESLAVNKHSVLIVDYTDCFNEAEKQFVKRSFPDSFILVL